MQRFFGNPWLRPGTCLVIVLSICIGGGRRPCTAGEPAVVPQGIRPLPASEDRAASMLAGIDRFLIRQIQREANDRMRRWSAEMSDARQRPSFLTARRRELRQILGMRETRVPFSDVERTGRSPSDHVAARNARVTVERIRWPVLADPDAGRPQLTSITGAGLLLTPTGTSFAAVIAVPDADQTPEQLCGLAEGVAPAMQFPRRLAEAGCTVFVPAITSRHVEARHGRARMTDREFAWRGGFVLGQHLLGYELHRILALVDLLATQQPTRSIGVIGYGEGGLLALLAGALDTRIDVTAVSGFFGPREQQWQEPLDRSVFGLLKNFGAAEQAAMLQPRPLIVETASVPTFRFSAAGGAPAVLTSPSPDDIRQELQRARDLGASISVTDPPKGQFGSTAWLSAFLQAVAPESLAPAEHPRPLSVTETPEQTAAAAEHRRQIQLQELDRHNQLWLREAPFVRQEFFADLDTSSLEAFERSAAAFRTIFRDDVIGRFDMALNAPDARGRRVMTTDHWTAWEIELTVCEDVTAFGLLLLPKDLRTGQRRPVIVCQHGLEGRPADTISEGHAAYRNFAGRLCERGFVVFAPQNLYIHEDRFRTLQRKANLLGCTLFSIMVPQHEQLIRWLRSQPFVDGERIAFYGLSYGGKSAMRIPALVPGYCRSICSGDFTEWIVKNASTRHAFSYMWTGEYEIFEWNLGRTFGYAEMAALICPRPFMVERGHFDPVGKDHWVAHEYAKVRHLYAARLNIPERTEIEWFSGPHAIHGEGTFRFLHRHLNSPEPE